MQIYLDCINFLFSEILGGGDNCGGGGGGESGNDGSLYFEILKSYIRGLCNNNFCSFTIVDNDLFKNRNDKILPSYLSFKYKLMGDTNFEDFFFSTKQNK